MIKGWESLEPLEKLNPEILLPDQQIHKVCDELMALNQGLLQQIIGFLRNNNYGRWADDLNGSFKASDERLFNCYFANRAYSYQVPQNPPDPLDGRRAALIFYLAHDLQTFLIDYIRVIPTAFVMNSNISPNPEEFTRIYRYVEFRQVLNVIKGVQYELEGFASCARYLLVDTDEKLLSFRSRTWPYDSEIMQDAVLLGFLPSGTNGVINSGILGSAVVAAGVVRSHLEAVLFKADFYSILNSQGPLLVRESLIRRQDTRETTVNKIFRVIVDFIQSMKIPSKCTIRKVDGEFREWDEALRFHRNAGNLNKNEEMWIREMYGLLSGTLHSGILLTRGEIWAFGRLVRHVRTRISG